MSLIFIEVQKVNKKYKINSIHYNFVGVILRDYLSMCTSLLETILHIQRKRTFKNHFLRHGLIKLCMVLFVRKKVSNNFLQNKKKNQLKICKRDSLFLLKRHSPLSFSWFYLRFFLTLVGFSYTEEILSSPSDLWVSSLLSYMDI